MSFEKELEAWNIRVLGLDSEVASLQTWKFINVVVCMFWHHFTSEEVSRSCFWASLKTPTFTLIILHTSNLLMLYSG